eukprot:358760-Chlamydomonas_euryale.AAC.5
MAGLRSHLGLSARVKGNDSRSGCVRCARAQQLRSTGPIGSDRLNNALCRAAAAPSDSCVKERRSSVDGAEPLLVALLPMALPSPPPRLPFPMPVPPMSTGGHAELAAPRGGVWGMKLPGSHSVATGNSV